MKILLRHIFILLCGVMFVALPLTASGQSVEKLKKERSSARKEIRRTRQKIDENSRETTRQLHALESLRGDIIRQKAIISATSAQADSVGRAMQSVSDSIAAAEAELSRLKKAYAASLRRMQGSMNPKSRWTFLLSAPDMGSMYRRARYLRRVGAAQTAKARRVRQQRLLLKERRERLSSLMTERRNLLQRASLAGERLVAQQQETDRVIASLRRQKGELQKALGAMEKRQRALDRQIDDMIARQIERDRRKAEEKKQREQAEKDRRNKEARRARDAARKEAPHIIGGGNSGSRRGKAAPQKGVADPDRKLSGSFEQNKGRLLFPVAGSYTVVRPFGRQRHPELPNVTTDNSGIDIQVKAGAAARAVFDGTVSAIFRQPGFGTIVMLRHGEYITIYAGLSSISVRNGVTVKSGQTLGHVAPDADNPSRGILHFELRKERTKLNPAEWVR